MPLVNPLLVVPKPPRDSLIQEIEFTLDRDDSYFGRCSSSSNYTLSENEQLFSNSEFAIDEKGLYLPQPNSLNRLILWDYQYSFEKLKKISWHFYNGINTIIYVNLFSQFVAQLQYVSRFTYYITFREFVDAGNTNSYSILARSIASFSPSQYNIWELDFENRMIRKYNSNSDYSLRSLVVEHEVAFNYKGILLLGWHGISSNQSHRLRKIIVEKCI